MEKVYTKLFKFLLLTVFVLSSQLIIPQTKAEKLESLLNEYYKFKVFNGSVLVSENGKVIYKNGFGLANMEWNNPNTTDTKFRIGSVTKQFTAMLIMQLVEEGKLKLDVPITTYIPDYP